MGAGNSYNFAITLFAALGGLTYGFSNSVIGSVLGLPGFFSYFDLRTTGHGASYETRIVGATSGLFAAGGAIGSFFLKFVADSLGRKRAIQIICVVCMISGALQAGSVHIAMFLVGRFLSGVAIGLIVSIIPVYQSEVSPPSQRGMMVGFHGGAIGCGYCSAAWIGYACYFSKNLSFQWRFMLAAQCFPPLILFIGSFKLPESPRWLVTQGRHQEALDILKRLHTGKLSNDSAEHSADEPGLAQREFQQISLQIELERELKTSPWVMVTKKSYRKRLFCGVFTQAIAQSTGVLVINNFQVSLYNGLGLYGAMPLLLYALYLTNSTTWNWIGAFLMDRTGRIPMMTFGLCGCIVAVSLETAMVAEFGGTTSKVGNGFGVFFLFMFGTIYGSCLDASTYVYSCEVFPTHLRAAGMGVSICGQFLCTLIFTQVAPTAFASIGWK
jgi:sugar porter (SP) family MFS transporter